jgi:hypothetical protein
MAQYVMVLRSATSLRGALEGVGPENATFLGPEMARAKRVPFGPKKVKDLKVFRKYRCHPVDLEIPIHFRQNI